MYELDYLYEQLKTKTLESEYIRVLDSISESCYDTVEANNAILETVQLIEEASKKGKLSFFEKLKTNIASAEKILSKYKDDALKTKPYGLEYTDFKTFMTDEQIKSRYKKALDYLNKFNPEKASEADLKKYIMDSNSNVQYREITKIFGDGKERFLFKDVIITKTVSKELTKSDISDAVKYLQTYTATITKVQKEYVDADNEYGEYVRSTGLITNSTKGDIEKLRKSAAGHKRALIAIADQTYYNMMLWKLRNEFNQAKHVVVKAANYNPRNLKESADIQFYIDAMFDFSDVDTSVIENSYEYENEYSVLEAFIIPDKSKFEDPDYINNYIKTISRVNEFEKNILEIIRYIYQICSVIVALTVVFLPVAILMVVISDLAIRAISKITDFTSLKSFEKTIEAINKAVKDLEKQKSDANATDKKRIESTIKQLKENKEKLKDGMKKAEAKFKANEEKDKK